MHAYQDVGYELLGDDPGVSGETFFAGARAEASWIFGRGPVHFVLGLSAAVESDATYSVAYQVQPVEGTQRVTRTIGNTHLALSFVRLGVIFDVP